LSFFADYCFRLLRCRRHFAAITLMISVFASSYFPPRDYFQHCRVSLIAYSCIAAMPHHYCFQLSCASLMR
jgi:hypothetical protein